MRTEGPAGLQSRKSKRRASSSMSLTGRTRRPALRSPTSRTRGARVSNWCNGRSGRRDLESLHEEKITRSVGNSAAAYPPITAVLSVR
jgi:hypothetical protein